ncbi:MAG: MFS transporter [Ardenticatenaceae bacterium]|nr:MFS transporter [Ardenticatenaceae bacterium]
MKNTPPLSHHPKRILAVLGGHALLRMATVASSASAMAGFYLAALARDGAPIGAGLVGLINGILEVAVLFGALPFGLLIDRRTPRFVLLLGIVMGALATQLFGLTALIPVFLVSRIVEGLAFAAVNPAALAHLTDATSGDEKRRGQVMSWFELTVFIGLALGSAVAGPLWEAFGTWGFSVMAIGYLLAGGLFYWGTAGAPPARETKVAGPSPLVMLKQAWLDPTIRRLAPAWLSANAIIGLWITHIVFQLSGPVVSGQYLVGRFSPTQVSLMAFIYSVLIGTGVVIWGNLLGRFSRSRAMMISLYGVMAVNVIFFLLNNSNGWPSWARWVVVAIYALFIMVQSGFTPAALAFLADIAGRRPEQGATMGIYTVLFSLGNILGAIIGAFLARWLAINGLVIGSVVLSLIAYFALRDLVNMEREMVLDPVKN